jgi:hypothetical protein
MNEIELTNTYLEIFKNYSYNRLAFMEGASYGLSTKNTSKVLLEIDLELLEKELSDTSYAFSFMVGRYFGISGNVYTRKSENY